MIETRSFKTNYRGELYIHASLGNVNIKERIDLLNLVGERSMHNGYVICKCNLVDCIYMSPSFVEDMKKIIIRNIFVACMRKVGMLGS